VTREITCLIFDDHEVVREGLRLSLSRAPHIRVIGEASDGASAVAMAERRLPDVVVMDVRMPGMDGLEACLARTADPRARGRGTRLHPQGGQPRHARSRHREGV
jgi:DNA-binding NarL/FixJ family response regulator